MLLTVAPRKQATLPEANRRLSALVEQLRQQGFLTIRAQATLLGVPVGALRNYLTGFPLPGEVARDIEWVLDLSPGWLDDASEHSTEVTVLTERDLLTDAATHAHGDAGSDNVATC